MRNLKKICIICVFIINNIFNSLFSQVKLGNEWIEYGKEYLKININEKGIYRISKKELTKAGFNLQNVNPKFLKLYFRGEEVAISINGESDNIFDDHDYIEFYAIDNDGFQDSELYYPIKNRANPYLSLYSNITAYFLIYSEKEFGKRMIENKNLNANTTSEKYYFDSIIKVYDEQWNFDQAFGFPTSQLINSYFEENEGLSGKTFRMDKSGADKYFNEQIVLNDVYINENQPNIEIEWQIFSRKNSLKTINWTINETKGNFKISNYNYIITKNSLGKINNNLLNFEVKIESSNDISIPQNDRFSIGYYKIKYPRQFKFKNNSEYNIIPNNQNKSTFSFPDLDQNIFGFDITDFKNQKKLLLTKNQNVSLITVDSTFRERKIFLTTKFKTPSSLNLILFRKKNIEESNYLIVTNKKLIESANEFLKYRSSTLGGNYSPIIKTIDEIYDEFSYGEKNPIGLIRYLKYFKTVGSPKFLLLIGKAYSIPNDMKLKESLDLVPTLGFPGSDKLLSIGLDSLFQNFIPIPTGRIAALENIEVINYLNKVKEYELQKNNTPWKKRFLHLSGGADLYQIDQFKSLLNNLGGIAKNSILGADFSILSKKSASSGVEDLDISSQINEGVNFLTFLGHSSSVTLDLNIGYVSNQTTNYKNKNQYPFMFFNGCSAAGIFGNTYALTNDWILTADKGAIGVLAHSYLSYTSSNLLYMDKLYSEWFGNALNINKPMGEIINKIDNDLYIKYKNDAFLMANIHQLILQGDPAIKIFNFNKPDYSISNNSIFLRSNKKNKAIAESDSITFGIKILNLGLMDPLNKLTVSIKQSFKNKDSEPITKLIAPIAYQDTIIFKIAKEIDLESILVNLDAELIIDEIEESNNSAIFKFNWQNLKNVDYYSNESYIDKVNPSLYVKIDNQIPIQEMKVGKNPLLELLLVDNDNFEKKLGKLEVYIKKICDNCSNPIEKVNLNILESAQNQIKINQKLENLPFGKYEIFIQGFDENRNPSGEVFKFVFEIIEKVESKIRVYPNPMKLYCIFEIDRIKENLNTKYTLEIFNSIGLKVYDHYGELNNGITQIYWKNDLINSSKIVPGIYFYKISFSDTNYNIGKLFIN